MDKITDREQVLIDMLTYHEWNVELTPTRYTIRDNKNNILDQGFRVAFNPFVVSALLFNTGNYKGLRAGRAALLGRIKEFVNELDS